VNLDADMRVEAAVLSNVLLDNALLDEVNAFLKPEHFHSEAHRRVFEACIALHEHGAPFDGVSVGAWLRNHERLAQVGGMAHLTEIVTASPGCTAAQTVAYARHVRDRWVRRMLAFEAQRTKSRCEADPRRHRELQALLKPIRSLRRSVARGGIRDPVDRPRRFNRASPPLAHDATR
jgi:replicative DNA helicase